LNLDLEGGWDEDVGGIGGLREYPGQVVVPTTVPFVACSTIRGQEMMDIPGGVMDSDKSYSFTEAKDALVAPIKPPYEAGIAKAKEAKALKKG